MNYHQMFEKDQFVEIHGADYKPAANAGDRIMLINTVTGAPYVCPDANGVVCLPDQETFNRMLAEGIALVHTRPSLNPAALRAARPRVETVFNARTRLILGFRVADGGRTQTVRRRGARNTG